MNLKKFNLFKTGLTEEEQELVAKEQSALELYKDKADAVLSTMRTSGFELILNKVITQTELRKIQLQRCSKEELDRLQLEIEVRMEFIHSFDEFVG